MRPKRTQNNGTFTTVLHAILATLAIILGAIWLVVGIGFGFGGATDAFDYVASHILVATGVVLVWNGALVLRMPARREERAQGITRGNEAQLDQTRAKELPPMRLSSYRHSGMLRFCAVSTASER